MPPTKRNTRRRGIPVVVEPDGDEFHAYCPTMKGLHVYGASEHEAKVAARAAIDVYLASLARHGDDSRHARSLNRRAVPRPPEDLVSPTSRGWVWVTADEVAALLTIDRKTVYFHVRAGNIPAKRIGRSLRFDLAAIDQCATRLSARHRPGRRR